MYLYKPEMLDKFAFPFIGIEKIDTSYSQLLQDMFVLAALSGKRDGKFLEIGGYHPTFISNTYLLEKDFGWSGVTIDLDPSAKYMFEQSGRKTWFIHDNALEISYRNLLREYFEDGAIIDYLQIDIEPNTNSLECLESIPFDEVDFRVITFETDFYDTANTKESNERVRSESREFLKSYGYVLVAGNLSNLDYDHPMEDWYLKENEFSKKEIRKFMRKSDETIPAHIYMGLG